MSKVVWFGTLAAALLLSVSTIRAQTAVKHTAITPIREVAGAATFKAYCAQCHGSTGIGDGPVAKALKVPPADLTRLAQRREGHFPAAHVKQVIMGDNDIVTHGGRDMPLWGEAFRSMENASVVELRVVNLVHYIETIQQK